MTTERIASEMQALQAQATELHDAVRAVEAALAHDHFDVSEDTRARLMECRRNLRWAAGDLEKARAELPPSEAHSVKVPE